MYQAEGTAGANVLGQRGAWVPARRPGWLECREPQRALGDVVRSWGLGGRGQSEQASQAEVRLWARWDLAWISQRSFGRCVEQKVGEQGAARRPFWQ